MRDSMLDGVGALLCASLSFALAVDISAYSEVSAAIVYFSFELAMGCLSSKSGKSKAPEAAEAPEEGALKSEAASENAAPAREANLDEVIADLEANKLRDLNLFGIPFADEGARRIANALPRCKGLTSLQLEAADITGEGVEALAAVAGLCPYLESINLSGNAVDDRGAIALARLLSRSNVRGNSALRTILLDNNAIGNDGALAFAEVLEDSKTLETLGLTGNSIGRIGGDAITNLLGSGQVACSVCLDGNPCRDLRMSKSAKSKVWAENSESLGALNGGAPVGEAAVSNGVHDDVGTADEEWSINETKYARLRDRLSPSCQGFKGASKGVVVVKHEKVSLLP